MYIHLSLRTPLRFPRPPLYMYIKIHMFCKYIHNVHIYIYVYMYVYVCIYIHTQNLSLSHTSRATLTAACGEAAGSPTSSEITWTCVW